MTDYASLRGTLASSKVQKDNNALFQTISSLISGAVSFQNSIDDLSEAGTALETLVNALNARSVFINEIDTSVSAQSFDPTNIVGFVIVKDISGNAAANNITITATVDNVLNPVINTDYGVYKLYRNSSGFFTW